MYRLPSCTLLVKSVVNVDIDVIFYTQQKRFYMAQFKIGLDVGSTTAKMVVLDTYGNAVFTGYERHHADIPNAVGGMLRAALLKLGDIEAAVAVTGSVGMGVSERLCIEFIQEVVAATLYVRATQPGIATIIDIGGEDAKIVYLKDNGNADLRMNGNCAGGTGSFIDQMATLINVMPAELGDLALKAESIYPIASRCGVFSKTDVQNLISKNVSKPDIAASVFHAVAVQTIVTLSHGYEVVPKILFCGGPLTFIPALRNAFVDYLHLEDDDYVIPENGNLIPAWGAAISAGEEGALSIRLSELVNKLLNSDTKNSARYNPRLPRIFNSREEYDEWLSRKSDNSIERISLAGYKGKAYLGIDSGSTTTKIVVTDDRQRIIFSFYDHNNGNPIEAVSRGLGRLAAECMKAETDLEIAGSCSTGYGEDLTKAAFGLDAGIIETIAHYSAARKICPEVSFILDIGGQDMKAMYVENGVLSRMEINEACSSGCGSFIETFATSLNFKVDDFAREACLAENPSDLGTRCTVFMNSKVKQVMREGATVGDIAAGLSYSVVRNCLYKVLKLKQPGEMGDNIVVQGGTMRNDSVVRALEILAGVEVSRSETPELMGAYGCALYAAEMVAGEGYTTISQLLATSEYESKKVHCKGCENQCYVDKYTFAGGRVYYSGNKCEKVFTNSGESVVKGRNMSAEKNVMLFERAKTVAPKAKRESLSQDALASLTVARQTKRLLVGIPRCLNIYENFPFWHKMFEECGIDTVISSPSTYSNYESGVHSVMSDNICFPAKLVHSHIYELIDARVDRIFFPYVYYERNEGDGTVNSYNCPIVSGYSEVIKNVIVSDVPMDSPVVTFNDDKLLEAGCVKYLATLGIDKRTAKRAVREAINAQNEFEESLRAGNREALRDARKEGKLIMVLAGRPYHTDPLIQHKLSDMISDMGVTVITEDIVRNDTSIAAPEAHVVRQWSYINRLLRTAQWVAEEDDDVCMVEMTSFGCGPDAFLTDEIRSVLARYGKSLTLLKIDDVNNIGSMKLRVRSVIDSMRMKGRTEKREGVKPFVTTKKFTKEERNRTILAPYFTDYVSPLIPSAFKAAGYDMVVLPPSDADSAEYGLMYANNEICYPATLIVGDMVKALKSGKYDLDKTAVIITQTGGQCRASNYISLIKKGIIDAGFPHVPVLSMAFGKGMMNEQSGFTINWVKMMPSVLAGILFSDCIAKFYYPAAVREKIPGEAKRLRDHYLAEAAKCMEQTNARALYDMIPVAAEHFNSIMEDKGELPKVGVVGEIFLKFNAFSHKNAVNWLVEQGFEVVPPILIDFFMCTFVNKKVKAEVGVVRKTTPQFLMDYVYSLIWSRIQRVNRLASGFRYYQPFTHIYEEAEHARPIINLAAQYGEGWLLPAELVSFAERGIYNVVSLQPFGCIANHIISKGVERRVKTLYPQMNILSLDFDGGVSDVNVTNRLMLMTNNIKRQHSREE